jgi:NAD-dependent dihydropyrimidine dehydrogenase PreA subunit
MRCPYGAFHHDGSTILMNGKRRKAVVFDPAKCYGCGLCRTGCPIGCIEMRPLAGDCP